MKDPEGISPQDAYQIIFNRINPLVETELANTKQVHINNLCDFCLRDGLEFGNTGVIWTDSYKYDNNICKTCNLFSEQLPIAIGNERGAIGYKLSSFKSGIVAIPTDENLPVELWIGGKYLLRVNHNGGFKVIDRTGNMAKFELCERIGDYSVVTEISLRREMFLRNIRLSDADNLYLSNETGSIHLNRQKYQALKHAFIKEGFKSTELLAVIDVLNAYKKGRWPTTHSVVQSTIKNMSPELAVAISDIPDPNSLVFILAGLKVGLLKEDVK